MFKPNISFLQTFPDLPSSVFALVLVYAVDEHQSFLYIRDILHEVRQRGVNPGAAAIVVANKADLVRSRDVKQEGKKQCNKVQLIMTYG